MQPTDPLGLIFILREEDEARFVRRDHQLDWMIVFAPALALLHALLGIVGGADLGACSSTFTLLRDLIHSDIFEISAC